MRVKVTMMHMFFGLLAGAQSCYSGSLFSKEGEPEKKTIPSKPSNAPQRPVPSSQGLQALVPPSTAPGRSVRVEFNLSDPVERATVLKLLGVQEQSPAEVVAAIPSQPTVAVDSSMPQQGDVSLPPTSVAQASNPAIVLRAVSLTSAEEVPSKIESLLPKEAENPLATLEVENKPTAPAPKETAMPLATLEAEGIQTASAPKAEEKRSLESLSASKEEIAKSSSATLPSAKEEKPAKPPVNFIIPGGILVTKTNTGQQIATVPTVFKMFIYPNNSQADHKDLKGLKGLQPCGNQDKLRKDMERLIACISFHGLKNSKNNDAAIINGFLKSHMEQIDPNNIKIGFDPKKDSNKAVLLITIPAGPVLFMKVPGDLND